MVLLVRFVHHRESLAPRVVSAAIFQGLGSSISGLDWD
jgi:hypothetical protein